MALEKCAATIAANIAMSCDNPIIPGFEEVGLLIAKSDIIDMPPIATNPRIKTAIQLKTGAKVCAIYNPFTTPFDGSQNAASIEGLIPSYTKTVQFGVPAVGGKISKDVIEPILKNRSGYVLILERKNKVGDGTFLIIGSETGAICNAQTSNPIDTTNNGMWLCTMEEKSAQFAEVTLYDTDFQTSRTEFERLLSLCF